MGNYMIIHKHLNHRIFLAKVVLSSPSPLSIPSFSTKVVTAIFSSLTAREQWEKFLHYKLLVIRIISPLMSEATSLCCLWRRTSSAQNPWSLLLCVLNKPSVYAVGLLQLSLLMLAVVFWTCLLNPPCNTTHLGLWSVPFSPSEMLVPVIGVLSINNDTKFPKLKLLHVNRLRGIFLCLFLLLSTFKTITPSGSEVFIEFQARKCFTKNVLRIELPDFAFRQQNLYFCLPFRVQKLEQLYILP